MTLSAGLALAAVPAELTAATGAGAASTNLLGLFEAMRRALMLSELKKIVYLALVVTGAGVLYQASRLEQAEGQEQALAQEQKADKPAPAPAAPPVAPAPPKGAKLKELLKLRLREYEQAFAIEQRMKSPEQELLRAEEGVLRAKLDLCETKEERLKTLGKLSDLGERQLAVALRKCSSERERSRIIIEHLEAEIPLERARQE